MLAPGVRWFDDWFAIENIAPGIHAIGDLITVDGKQHAQLAHVASAEGIRVAEKLAGKHFDPIDYAFHENPYPV